MSRSLLATGLSLLLLAGCQEQAADTQPFTATDSAGVTIVESARPLWERGAGWTLSPEPELVIGRADRAVVIELENASYDRLVVEVRDPQAAVRMVRSEMQRAGEPRRGGA